MLTPRSLAAERTHRLMRCRKLFTAALAEYEQSIQDQLDKISAVRAAVLHNEEKIGKLMAGVMNVAASAP